MYGGKKPDGSGWILVGCVLVLVIMYVVALGSGKSYPATGVPGEMEGASAGAGTESGEAEPSDGIGGIGGIEPQEGQATQPGQLGQGESEEPETGVGPSGSPVPDGAAATGGPGAGVAVLDRPVDPEVRGGYGGALRLAWLGPGDCTQRWARVRSVGGEGGLRVVVEWFDQWGLAEISRNAVSRGVEGDKVFRTQEYEVTGCQLVAARATRNDSPGSGK